MKRVETTMLRFIIQKKNNEKHLAHTVIFCTNYRVSGLSKSVGLTKNIP